MREGFCRIPLAASWLLALCFCPSLLAQGRPTLDYLPLRPSAQGRAEAQLYEAALNSELMLDVPRAAVKYLLLAKGYPDSRHRQESLWKAAHLFAADGNGEEAGKAFELYVSLYPTSPQAQSAWLGALRSWQRKGDDEGMARMIRALGRLRGGEALAVEGHCRLGDLSLLKGNPARARDHYRRALSRYGAKSRGAAFWAAKAAFRMAGPSFDDGLSRVRVAGGRGLAKRTMAQAARQARPFSMRSAMLENPEWALEARVRVAQAYGAYAQAVRALPDRWGQERQRALEALEPEAIRIYEEALAMARGAKVGGEGIALAREGLAGLRPERFAPPRREKMALSLYTWSPGPLALLPQSP